MNDRAAQTLLQPSLSGPTLTLRPLQGSDFEAMYAAAADPLIWIQHPSPTRYQRPAFEGWFADAIASGGALAVVDRESGTIIGSSRYYEWDAAKREVAIGYTFLARSHWGGATNAEMKRLMLKHAFEHVQTVWFHVVASNIRSQRAMQKIGAVLSHRDVRDVSGTPTDYLYFRIERDDPWRHQAVV